MFSSREDSRSAVMFFSEQRVVKELLYSEFEALLESFTPETEWAGQEAFAAYFELTPSLQLAAAVFFVVDFDSDGWVDASWNIPLVNLARSASPHPQMAQGLRVACRSHSPDAQYQEGLWDPDLSPNSVILQEIAKALAVNKLGFSQRAQQDSPAMADALVSQANATANSLREQAHNDQAAVMQAKITQLLQDQKHQGEALAKAMAQVESVKAAYDQKLSALNAELANQVRQFEGTKEQLNQVTAALEGKAKQLTEVSRHYALKHENTTGDQSDYISALRAHFSNEADTQINQAESKYKELLNGRDAELMYRAERETQLHNELVQLRHINKELALMGDGDLLQTMSDKGITFITYQIGLGHINIPVNEIPLYLDNPIGFVSAYCNVTQAVYLDWLAHFHAPICRAQLADQNYCGEAVSRVNSPEHFMIGVSDCCDAHQHKS